MNPDYAQRRRVAIAAAITAIAVPTAFLLSRGESGAGGAANGATATVAGTVVGTVPGASPDVRPVVDPATAPDPASSSTSDPTFDPTADPSESPDATDPLGTAAVGYLDGTVPPVAGDPATIAVPRASQSITGTALFRRDLESSSVCQIPGAPFNATVMVTNLDNSRSVQCVTSVAGPAPASDVVLHVDAFVLIADLTDAPVPVEVSW